MACWMEPDSPSRDSTGLPGSPDLSAPVLSQGLQPGHLPPTADYQCSHLTLNTGGNGNRWLLNLVSMT